MSAAKKAPHRAAKRGIVVEAAKPTTAKPKKARRKLYWAVPQMRNPVGKLPIDKKRPVIEAARASVEGVRGHFLLQQVAEDIRDLAHKVHTRFVILEEAHPPAPGQVDWKFYDLEVAIRDLHTLSAIVDAWAGDIRRVDHEKRKLGEETRAQMEKKAERAVSGLLAAHTRAELLGGGTEWLDSSEMPKLKAGLIR